MKANHHWPKLLFHEDFEKQESWLINPSLLSFHYNESFQLLQITIIYKTLICQSVYVFPKDMKIALCGTISGIHEC